MYLVFEYMEADLHNVIKKVSYSQCSFLKVIHLYTEADLYNY